jgi:hypothetical protein
MRRRVKLRAIAAQLAMAGLLCALSCSGAGDNSIHRPLKPPYKPGDSITKTRMCSCKVCDPASCCRELEQDRPEMKECAEGYDFSKCELSVSSCQANCYQNHWRTAIDGTCEDNRPDTCCHKED